MRIRIAKSNDNSKVKEAIVRITSILAALSVTSIFIAVLGLNPFEVYKAMLEGCFGSAYRLEETIIKTIPLLITSLGIAIAFRMKFWNIGAEGQMIMGAFTATFFALHFGDFPRPLLLTLMVIAGMIGGGLWGLFAAFLKVKFDANETIVTLMMNYIALKWIVYLQYGPWKDSNSLGFPKIANFTDNAILPEFLNLHIGWIFALILVVLAHWFIHYTKKGFEIQVLGESENTARYAGMDVGRIILLTLFLSGGIAGLAGMIQASAVDNTLSIQTTGGVGYTAIIIAWLSNLSAPLAIIVSFLFAILTQGASYIQTVYQIPQSAAQIIQGMILCFVLGGEFFTQYKFIVDVKPNKGQLLGKEETHNGF